MAASSSSMAGETLGSHKIKKTEFVRAIAEALQSLGYQETSKCLEEESQILISSHEVSAFTELVLDGKWDASLIALKQIQGLDETVLKSVSFFILEQQFLQLMEENKTVNALKKLREEITPLSIERERVRELSAMTVGVVSVKPKPKSEVLRTLQDLFPPGVVIPRGRLLQLLDQALQNSFVDHDGSRTPLPTRTVQMLQGHQDEVLFIMFSHNGMFLASGSKDNPAIIWRVHRDGILELQRVLRGHNAPICCLSWGPNDEQLLTCGLEETVRRWDVKSGRCLGVFTSRNRGMISCGWSPDGQYVFSGLTTNSIMMWDLDAKNLDGWMRSTTSKNCNLQITSDGKHIISLSKDNIIVIIDRVSGVHTTIQEEDKVVSFVLAGDDKFLLVSLQNREIHLWSIDGERRVVASYKGRTCSRFVVRACFGGSGQALVASGSEDSRVYIWHRETGELLKTLGGHSGTVNCTSWNPVIPHMLASGSADQTIRVWGLNPNSA